MTAVHASSAAVLPPTAADPVPRRPMRTGRVDDVPVAVLGFDRDGLVRVNRRWLELTGLTLAASTGSGWLAAVHSDDWMTARRFVQTAREAETVSEWRVLGVGGRDTVWVQATSSPVRGGTEGAFVVALTEIDAHKANEAGLLHRAIHDPLTGLLNQAAFTDRVVDAVERATTEVGLCAVLYLDLDHFKDVNDTFGHKCGDLLLAAVSRRIRASLRPSDTLARLGGDEIGVLCPTLDSEAEAIRLAERIAGTIAQPFTIDGQVLHTSVSVGLAFSNGTGRATDDLVDQADQAMYRAKSTGGARWATKTRASTVAPLESVDVEHVRVRVEDARAGLDDLLAHLDLGELERDRLVQASHALARVAHLLAGDSRIG